MEWNTTVRVERNRVKAPQNSKELFSILIEAINKFRLTETQYVLNLPAAIAGAVLDKDMKSISRECSERKDCVQLKGTEIFEELYEVEKLLTWTKNIKSKRRFLGFVKDARIEKHVDVLKWKRTAKILKPSYGVICDRESKCLIVFIRGTHTVKDTLTDALCAPVPFEHLIYSSAGKMKTKVSGYAHRGMIAAAAWIKKSCISILLDALQQHPHFKIKIVGHSLGGGTAALLTYMLREIQQFSSTTCVTFGPAACMTMELAQFGKSFITSIINGNDIVPTLSASSVHDFLSQGQITNEKILTGVGSFLPKFAKALAKEAITHCTKVIVSSLAEASLSYETNKHFFSEDPLMVECMSDDYEYSSSSEESDNDDPDDEEDKLLNQDIHFKDKEAKNIIKGETSSGRRYLYPPGKIMHIVLANLSGNFNPHNRYGVDEKHVCIYETPREMYGKVRFSKGMILDHRSKKYLQMIRQVINQVENISSSCCER